MPARCALRDTSSRLRCWWRNWHTRRRLGRNWPIVSSGFALTGTGDLRPVRPGSLHTFFASRSSLLMSRHVRVMPRPASLVPRYVSLVPQVVSLVPRRVSVVPPPASLVQRGLSPSPQTGRVVPETVLIALRELGA